MSFNFRFRILSAVLLAVFPLCWGVLSFLVGPLPSAADDLKPPPRDRNIANLVALLLQQDHLSGHRLDDEISKRSMKAYLEMLDPAKSYFLKSDVLEFRRFDRELDDRLKRYDTSLAYEMFNRLLKRIDEKLPIIDQTLQVKHDYQSDEDYTVDPDLLDYPANEKEVRERWRRRIKYELLALQVDDKMSLKEAQDKLWRRYHGFAKRMHMSDVNEVLEMFLTAMTTSFDPHTTYMAPSTLETFRMSMRLNLEGIGATLRIDDGYDPPVDVRRTRPDQNQDRPKEGMKREAHFVCKVVDIVPGGAADRQGELKPDDYIISVGEGDNGKMVNVVDMKIDNVVKLIRGKAGTVVRLQVQTPGKKETRVVRIQRDRIELKGQAAKGTVFENGHKAGGEPLKIGVIDLPSFYMDMERARGGGATFKSSTRDVKKILDDFKQQKVDAVVLDLRRNGGGSLTEAIRLTGLFLKTGTVVQVKDLAGDVEGYDDPDPSIAWSGPLVVVTSRLSASASEILAGAIKDYRRGLVIGDTQTFGKGTVQSLLDLGEEYAYRRRQNPPNWGALKLTMQKFYRPTGASTQLRGVASDIILPSLTDHLLDIGEGKLDYAVKWDRTPAGNFRPFEFVDADLVKKLRQASSKRIAVSGDFSNLHKQIEFYNRWKKRKFISLNRQKFVAERKALEAIRNLEKEFQDRDSPNPKPLKNQRDFYLNEVMAIAADFVRLKS